MSQKADRFKHIGEKILKRPETMESFLTDYQKPANNTMKMFFSHGATETDFYDPYRVLTSTFKFNVEQLTNGRFQVQSFPNNQLGGIVATLQQCERGLLEMTTSQNTSYVASWVPDVQVLDLPYLFPSLEVARKVLNGQFGQYLSDSIAEKCGLRVLAWLPTAMRNFGTNMEVKTPGDLKGKKIRTMGAPVYVELVKALGAAPTSIPWKELYTSLQTGVAEGHDQPPYVMRRFKFYEVNKSQR